MDEVLLQQANTLKAEIDELEDIFKRYRASSGYGDPPRCMSITFGINMGTLGQAEQTLHIPNHLAENILGLVEKRIDQILEIKRKEFAELK